MDMKLRLFYLLGFLIIVSLVLVACSTPTTAPTTSAPAPASKPPVTSASPSTSAPAANPAISSSIPAQSASVLPSPKPAAPTASTGSQQYGGTLRLIIQSPTLYMGDPTLMSDSVGNCQIPCLEALVVSDNSGQMHGVLATNWNVAPDGKSITFNLRKGVKFHDGSDFNATAAKWNMDRFKAATPGSVPQWASIDVVDDYTIKLNLKSFQNTILNDLEITSGTMVSPTAAQKNGVDWMKTNEAGTGPFMLKNYSRDVSAQYVRFDNYWGNKPYLDGITILFIADANTARATFESGGADILSSNSEAITNDMVKKGYPMESRPGSMMCLVPDSKRDTSPYSKLGVRQAISYGIDREGMAKTLGYGYWEVVNQQSAAYQFSHLDANQVPYKYDPAKAKQLLAAAGYPNGFATSIIWTANFSNSDPLVAMQSTLKDIGITMTLKQVDFAAWNDSVNKGWDSGLVWATQGATDTNYAAFLKKYYSATSIRYPVMAKPAGFTDLVDQALATPDYAAEKTICQKALKMLIDDCTTIPAYIKPMAYILQKNVHDTNFSNVGGGGFRWTPGQTWLEKGVPVK
jgi:peptide/nickel transport system substrate-binding protein